MSIEAMNWARRIYVGDSLGKSVLRALADYADENGQCFPSLARLALDCDLSIDSVRRRIKVLEDAGLIVTFRAWMDEHGKRNQEGRGRETSRDVRLLLDVVRTRASSEESDAGDGPSDEREVAPLAGSKGPLATGEGSQQLGRGSTRARGGVALVPPPNEPSSNQESPPLPPSGGREGELSDEGEDLAEPEHFAEMWQGYPGHEAMDRRKSLAVFIGMTPEERQHARYAAPKFAESLRRLGRKNVPNCERWLRDKRWLEFPGPQQVRSQPERRWISVGSVEHRALCVAAMVAGHPPPTLIADRERGQGLWRLREASPDLLALAAFADQQPDDWELYEQGSPHFAAWRDLVQSWLGRAIELRSMFIEPHDPAVHDLPVLHPDFRPRRRARGLRAPCLWPPRRDGTFGNADQQAEPARSDNGTMISGVAAQ
ncbi:MAG TPA: helix-turn-helix domain-containing protein [Xanthobacteraceae bacterium]|nr:helix-turn-helix domain-containing protein [Xanthobacteraceae bacterium]